MKEKKEVAVLEGFFSSILSLFLSLSFSDVTCIFPFFDKRGNTTQHKRGKKEIGTSTRLNELNKTQLRSIFSPETWDLLPLSPVCNPYYKLVPVTRAATD